MIAAGMVAASSDLEMPEHYQFPVDLVGHFGHENLNRDILLLAIVKEITGRSQRR